METPSSTRMVTRSQARAALSNSTHNIPVSKNGEEFEKNMQTSRPKAAKKDRSGLIDITNDSPIVGVAGKSTMFEMETPLSSVSKRGRKKSTPGSGEALLRGQVKTLLQKVEEEAQISTFLGSITTHGRNNPRFLGFPNSPMGILAPTPANTPQIYGSAEQPAVVFTEYPIEDKLKISQVVSDLFDGKMVESSSVDSDKSFITRSLLLDFSDKSDDLHLSISATVEEEEAVSDCSSVMTYQSGKEKEEEEEDASIWSIQVNASTRDEDEDEDKDIETENEEEDEFDENYEDEDEVEVDELCYGMSKISVADGVRFEGKHTRFVYNTKDEIEGKEDVVHLKGVPTPKGKHLRFEDEDEE